MKVEAAVPATVLCKCCREAANRQRGADIRRSRERKPPLRPAVQHPEGGAEVTCPRCGERCRCGFCIAAARRHGEEVTPAIDQTPADVAHDTI